jgi:hypothetical protein
MRDHEPAALWEQSLEGPPSGRSRLPKRQDGAFEDRVMELIGQGLTQDQALTIAQQELAS